MCTFLLVCKAKKFSIIVCFNKPRPSKQKAREQTTKIKNTESILYHKPSLYRGTIANLVRGNVMYL